MDEWLALYHADDGSMRRTRSADCPQLEMMGWKRGHPVVYWAHYGIPDHALVPSFHPGLQLLSAPLFPPPRPLLSLFLQRVCRPFISCTPTPLRFSFFLLAGPSQDMCFDSLRHQTVLILVFLSVYGHHLPLTGPKPSLCGAIAYSRTGHPRSCGS
jgi:hypothetical protein